MGTGHTDPSVATSADRINELTVRWLRELVDETPHVASGAGIWPLLVALQLGADDRSGAELASATGIEREDAAGHLAHLFELLGESPTIHAALGVWAADSVELRPDWLERLPAGIAGRLSGDTVTDQVTVDSWAATHTDNLIPRLPLDLIGETDLILASALALRTRWSTPFEDHPWHFLSGPWSGTDTWLGLTAVSSDLSELRIWDDGSTTLRVPGEADLDVVLVIADPDKAPATVLADAMDNPTRGVGFVSGGDLTVGETAAGVQVTEVSAFEPDPQPWLQITTVAFDVTSTHDLLRNAAVFGLESSMRRQTSPLTALTVDAAFPMVVTQVSQSALARFSAVGFEAAVVTAVAAAMAAAPESPDETLRKVVSVTFDRPFGYLAVHRPTGLVMVAGWVDHPTPWQDA